ncbi:MAG TPA: hypothetical protein VM056_05715 [Terriglobales bacterium]|nr:hypothetical protein [Terriglobales bacterium]
MNIWKTIKGYIFWTYDRGGLHYDVMVTMILAFIFISPHYIDFNDKPVERTPHQSGVIVNPDGQDGFVYEIPAAAVGSAPNVEAALLRVIEPIAGEVTLVETRMVTDAAGRVVMYRARVRKP